MFSVLVPVYNTEKYLRECIESVINQTYKEWTLILANDGSTDSSPLICEEYQKKFPEKIKYYSKENEGLLLTRFFLQKKAKDLDNEYVLHLDSDDFFELDAFERIYNHIIEYKYPDCIFFGINIWIANKENKINEIRNKNEYINSDLKKNIMKHFLYWGENSMCSKVYKKNLFTEEFWTNCKRYNITIGEDFLQNCELLFTVKNFLLVKDVLYNYRKNITSTTNKVKTSQLSRENSILDTIKRQEYIVYKFKKEKINQSLVSFHYNNFYTLLFKGLSFVYDRNKQYEFLKLLNDKKLIIADKRNLKIWIRFVVYLVEKRRYKLASFILRALRKCKHLVLWFKY